MENDGTAPLTSAFAATLGQVQNSSVPLNYGDKTAEYNALNHGVALLDLSPYCLQHLTGKDRVRYLHGMISHDVKKLPEGQGRYATLMTSQGRTISDLWVFNHPEHIALLLPPGVNERVMQHLDFYLIADKADFEDQNGKRVRVSLQGPGTTAFLESISPLPEAEYAFVSAKVADIDVEIYRVDRTAKGGFDLECEAANGEALWNALVEKGAVPAGYQAWDMVRVVAGIPWSGHELTEKVIPMEAHLTDTALSFDKGCYIGQEVVAKIKYRGKVNRLLSKVELPEFAEVNTPLKGPKKDAGWLTSLVTLPDGRHMGLAYLRRQALEGEDAITVGEHADQIVQVLP